MNVQCLYTWTFQKYTLTVDAEVDVLGLFPSCVHHTALVAGLVSKTGTFYPQYLTSVGDLQVGITKKHQSGKEQEWEREQGCLKEECLISFNRLSSLRQPLLPVLVPLDCGKGHSLHFALKTDLLFENG